jgi:glycosyltransferase involved in cell wall biosynthesis
LQCISVIIPALNNADTIGDTLSSCLGEPEVGEVIVVLSSSSDHTASVVESFTDERIVLLETEVRGISKQMNIGLARANFAYCCKIDADDMIISRRFALQAAFLDFDDQFLAVAGGLATMKNDGTFLTDAALNRMPGNVTGLYRNGYAVAHFGTLLIRTCALKKIGGFREWFHVAEDNDTAFRIANIGQIWLSDIPAYRYRIRPSSIVHSTPEKISRFYADAAVRFAKQRVEGGLDDLCAGCPPSPPDIRLLPGSKPISYFSRMAGYLEFSAWWEFENRNHGRALLLMFRSLIRSPLYSLPSRGRKLCVMAVKAAARKLGKV